LKTYGSTDYGALKPSNNNEACRCKVKADEFVIINHHQSILFKSKHASPAQLKADLQEGRDI
jgi:hypothetical protein